MVVKLAAKSVLLIESDSHVAVEFLGGDAAKLEAALKLAAEKKEGYVTGPGEYEYTGIELAMLETKSEHNGQADMAHIRVEGVNVLCVFTTPGEIDKEQWEHVENVHVLCLDQANVKLEDASKWINMIDPHVVLILNAATAEAEQWTGMTAEATEKKFKFSEKDFDQPEPITKLFVLA